MADVATAETCARAILSIFKEHGVRAGETLAYDDVQIDLSKRLACPPSGCHVGVNFAVEAGWLEPASDTLLRLTQAGFDVTQVASRV